MNNDFKDCTKMLYVVDMVNGFTKKGPLHDEKILDIVPEQEKIINEFIKEKEGLNFIKDTHNEDAIEFKTFPTHCLKGDYESELISEFKKYENMANIYEKNSTNAIYAPGLLDDILKNNNLKDVFLVGCCTDICVMDFGLSLRTMFNQLNQDTNVYVIKNATSTYDVRDIHDSKKYSEEAYELMELCGIKIINSYEDFKKQEQNKKLCLKGGK